MVQIAQQGHSVLYLLASRLKQLFGWGYSKNQKTNDRVRCLVCVIDGLNIRAGLMFITSGVAVAVMKQTK